MLLQSIADDLASQAPALFELVPIDLARSATVQNAKARTGMVRNELAPNDSVPTSAIRNAAIQIVMGDRRCPDVQVELAAHCVAEVVHSVAVAVHYAAVLQREVAGHCAVVVQREVAGHCAVVPDRQAQAIHCVFQGAPPVLNVPECG